MLEQAFMVDYASPWDSMQPRNEMPLHQVRKSAKALANLLDENKDEQVLKEACLGLCQLFGEGIQNDRIQAILEADVVPKLVCLLRPSKSRVVPISVQSAALQVLGNVACGDDRQTQVVIDSDALPCLRALLSSLDRGIRKEVCWIVSNITESSHQVQDVLDADILPPLLKLVDNQDTACREDATWVLFNLSSNRDPNQIGYLADKNGIRALCNLLACPKDLDVLWKGCGTVAAVALKGLRNILICGHTLSTSNPNPYNEMALLVAEAHGVERIEALTNHDAPDVRNRARLILERMFGTEPSSEDNNSHFSSSSAGCSPSIQSTSLTQSGCSCLQQKCTHPGTGRRFETNGLYETGANLETSEDQSPNFKDPAIGNNIAARRHQSADLDVPGSSSGSSTDSDLEDDDSDSDVIPPPLPACSCKLCTDSSPLLDRRSRGRVAVNDGITVDIERQSHHLANICIFCSGGGRISDGRSGLAAKLGRAVRLGHSHCLAVLLSRMTWSQRVAATEAPALLHPGGGPPDGGISNSLPAVVLAAQLGKLNCLSLLLHKCRPDLDITFGKKRLTALAWAAHKGYFRCCQLLIEHGSNVGVKCGDGVTALHLAASGGGHIAVCKLLIDHNAPVNAQSFKKQTALCLAAQKGSYKVVQMLLEHGADANNQDEGKYTPLHLAASKGFEHCVDLLLNADARVDSTTRKGVTPLHYAVQGGYAGVVRLLITAGAQVNCTHKPLLLIAADDGNVEVVHSLLEANATIDCKANIRAMLDKDTEVSDFLTPLHLAASKAHQDVVELLISRGANVNEITSKRGWSALDFAVLNAHADCAVTLLKHGAVVTDNCKSIGRNNWTLVQYAAHHGAKDVVRLLVQRLKEQRMMRSVNGLVTEGIIDNSKLSNCSSSFGSSTVTSLYDAGESVNSSFKAKMTDDGALIEESDQNVEQVDCNLNMEACDPLHPHCLSQNDLRSNAQPSHRYDPRSLEGDEAGFGTGPGYGTKVSTSDHTPFKSRRRVNKEDRQLSTRTRELKKRELEASEARDRLEEAMNQRSVAKLTEAIAHVSKLVLHLATSAGTEQSVTGQSDQKESDDCELHGNDNGYIRGHCSSDKSLDSSCVVDHIASEYNSLHPNGPHTPCKSSSPLAMEVGLGNEVRKARKVLAGLLAEEKRVRELKEKVAADSKRENAQIMVKKATKAVKDGRDPRSLTRAIARATRNILDKNEDIITQANSIVDLVTKLEKDYATISKAIHEHDLEVLCGALPETSKSLSRLRKKGGDGAAQRVFGGGDPTKFLIEGEKLKKELQAKRDHAIQEAKIAKDMELGAKQNLETVMESNNIVALELATKKATRALLSKDSELGSTIEVAKKTLAKWVKGERRKLKQARNSNDPLRIEETAAAASKLGLQSLQADIDGAKAHAQNIREQTEALKALNLAISNSDTLFLNEIRSRLTKLGMFTDAEKARSEVERLQRAKRARTLLEESIEMARRSRDEITHILSFEVQDLDINESNAKKKSSSSIRSEYDSDYVRNKLSRKLLSWTWPDAQRLHELSERAKQSEQSPTSLSTIADDLVQELAELGREVLRICEKSDDARFIAAMVAGYEKSFVFVSNPEVFDKIASDTAIGNVRKRLAFVQAKDQERVKAESAQVKVEYAIATSRRALTSRQRDTRRRVGSAENIFGNVPDISVRGNISSNIDDGNRSRSYIQEIVKHNKTNSSPVGHRNSGTIDGPASQLCCAGDQTSENSDITAITHCHGSHSSSLGEHGSLRPNNRPTTRTKSECQSLSSDFEAPSENENNHMVHVNRVHSSSTKKAAATAGIPSGLVPDRHCSNDKHEVPISTSVVSNNFSFGSPLINAGNTLTHSPRQFDFSPGCNYTRSYQPTYPTTSIARCAVSMNSASASNIMTNESKSTIDPAISDQHTKGPFLSSSNGRSTNTSNISSLIPPINFGSGTAKQHPVVAFSEMCVNQTRDVLHTSINPPDPPPTVQIVDNSKPAHSAKAPYGVSHDRVTSINFSHPSGPDVCNDSQGFRFASPSLATHSDSTITEMPDLEAPLCNNFAERNFPESSHVVRDNNDPIRESSTCERSSSSNQSLLPTVLGNPLIRDINPSKPSSSTPIIDSTIRANVKSNVDSQELSVGCIKTQVRQEFVDNRMSTCTISNANFHFRCSDPDQSHTIRTSQPETSSQIIQIPKSQSLDNATPTALVPLPHMPVQTFDIGNNRSLLETDSESSACHPYRQQADNPQSNICLQFHQTRPHTSTNALPLVERLRKEQYSINCYHSNQSIEQQYRVNRETFTQSSNSFSTSLLSNTPGEIRDGNIMTELIGIRSSATAAATAAAAAAVPAPAGSPVPIAASVPRSSLNSLPVVESHHYDFINDTDNTGLDQGFENENFGFDINSIVSDNLPPPLLTLEDSARVIGVDVDVDEHVGIN